MTTGVYLYFEKDLGSYDEYETFIEAVYEVRATGTTPNTISKFKAFLSDFYATIHTYKNTALHHCYEFYHRIQNLPFELDGGRYDLLLPPTHRISTIKTITEIAAKHQLVVMLEQNADHAFYFFPDGNVEPYPSWQSETDDTLIEESLFPHTVPQFKKSMAAGLNPLLMDHGFSPCTIPFLDDEKGYAKTVALGKIYCSADYDKSKWGGFRFNLYFYFANERYSEIYQHIYPTKHQGQLGLTLDDFETHIRIENFTDKEIALKKVQHYFLNDLIPKLATIFDLDALVNGYPSSKIQDKFRPAQRLIIAKLAGNPHFEAMALKWQHVASTRHDDTAQERNQLINYLRAYPPTEGANTTNRSMAQPSLCTLRFDMLYIWNPQHDSIQPVDDISAKQCLNELASHRPLSPAPHDIQTLMQDIVLRFEHHATLAPELVDFYRALATSYQHHRTLLCKIPLPKAHRLLARHEIIRLATERGLLVYDGQSNTAFFPDEETFKQRMQAFGLRFRAEYDQIRQVDKGSHGHAELYNMTINDFPNLALDAFAAYLPLECAHTMSSVIRNHAEACGLTVYEQGLVFLKTGNIYPKNRSADSTWRAGLKYLHAKLQQSATPLNQGFNATLPISALMDDLLAKYGFKKSVLPLLYDLPGYYRRTSYGVHYLTANDFADLGFRSFIMVDQISAIYQQFAFTAMPMPFTLTSSIANDLYDKEMSYLDIDHAFADLETQVVVILRQLESLADLDAAINRQQYPSLKLDMAPETLPIRLILARLSANPDFESMVSLCETMDAAEWGVNQAMKDTELPKLTAYLRQLNV